MAAVAVQGIDAYITDVVSACDAFEYDVGGIDGTDEITPDHSSVVGIDAAYGNLGYLPAVDVQGVEVGITDIGVEAVQRIPCPPGKIEETLEHEVLIKVEGVSKKFCKDLNLGLLYGLQDLGSGMFGKTKPRV